jgi:PAS domain-containing protein
VVLERERGVRALRDSEERLRLAMEVASMGHWVWDVTADRVRVIQGTADAHLAELVPPTLAPAFDTFLETVDPADRDRVAAAVKSALRDGVPYNEEFRLVHPDGGVSWVAARGVRRRAADAV